MNQTRTGKCPIGFPRGGSEWQCDLQGALGFAKANQSAGLCIGTVDLNNHTAMVSADARKRKATAQHLRVCPSNGLPKS